MIRCATRSRMAEALAVCERYKIAEVIVAMPSADPAFLSSFVRRLEDIGIRITEPLCQCSQRWPENPLQAARREREGMIEVARLEGTTTVVIYDPDLLVFQHLAVLLT